MLRPARQPSACREADLAWDAQLPDVRRLFVAALLTRQRGTIDSLPLALWGGYTWRLQIGS